MCIYRLDEFKCYSLSLRGSPFRAIEIPVALYQQLAGLDVRSQKRPSHAFVCKGILPM